MKNSAIEWCENTINWYMGCTKVSEGCKNCYMYRLMKRFGKDPYILNKMNFQNIEKNLQKWQPSKIFVNSMSDTFHDELTFEQIDEMFKLMFNYDKHTYIILTKRILRAKEYFDITPCPQNFWIGTSVESEKYMSRIEVLKSIPSGVRFVSFEPLLEKINSLILDGIQWVIVGGESDPNPRPMYEDYAINIFNECQKLGIPYFFKQWGGKTKCKCHNAWGCRIFRGKTWDEYPTMAKPMIVR